MAVQKTGNLESRIIQLENKNLLSEQQFQNYKIEVAQNSKEDLNMMQSYVQTHDSFVIGCVALMIAIVAVIGVLWNKKVEKNLEKIEKIKLDIEEIEKSLDEKIEGELSEKIFQRFQDKEEDYIFDRLLNYDIAEILHYEHKLLTMKFLKQDRFNVLMSFAEKAPRFKGNFINIMLQHFPEKFGSNKIFRDMVLPGNSTGTMFQIEIINGTRRIHEEIQRIGGDSGILQEWINYLRIHNRVEYESSKSKIQEILSGIKDISY